MPDATTHPSVQELSDFGLGRLSAEAAATIAGHLEICPACQQAVAELPPDSFVGKVRAAQPSPASVPGSRHAPGAEPAAPPEGLPPELASYPKYRFVRELGRGGMGVVYLAEQTLMKRRVAIKVINPGVLAHPSALPRFQAEVQAAATLDHPNIVRAHDAEQVGGLHLLVMEFVEGTNLADLVQRKGPLPVAHACHFIRQAALGLQHAFEQGMIHRDIKPHNLMVGPKGQVKVLDFGLARLRSGGPGLTEIGSFMGTPEYVSPEQATDAHAADTRADLYSLGCTLFFLLTGRPPFADDNAVKVILAHIDKEAPPVQELRPEVPAELSAVVARLLAKDPAQRFQTPVEVARALVPFIKQGTKRAAVSLPPLAMPVSERGTALGGNTSKILKARDNPAGQPPAAPAAGEDQPAAPFADLAVPGAPLGKATRVRPVQAAPTAWYRRPPLLAGAAAAVLALGLGIWLVAGVILKVPTKGGTLVIDVNEPDATVLVDGKQVTVTWANGSKHAEIPLPAGQHQVTVTKDGFTVRGDGSVTLEESGRKILMVTLEKTPAPPPGESGGFVPLFNGKDLTGWYVESGDPAAWKVEGEAVVARGGDWKTQTYLLTEREYSDFVLRLEFALEKDTSSAVALRAIPGETWKSGAGVLPFHPVVKLTDNTAFPREPTGTHHGVMSGATGSLPNHPADLKPLGEWNKFEMEVQGEKLRASVNSKLVIDVKLDPTARAGAILPALNRVKGRVGLQKHTWTVRFRNIEIKELPRGHEGSALGEPGKGERGTRSCRLDETVHVTAKKEHGYVVGKVGKGEAITLQYVSGKWKAWGQRATESPDALVQERGDQCRLAICEAMAGNRTKVSAVVPAGTKAKPYVWVADRDYEKIVLRINGPCKNFTSNPDAKVHYRLKIESPEQGPSAPERQGQ